MKMSHWMLSTLAAMSLMAGVHAAEAPAKQETTTCAQACEKACAKGCACEKACAEACKQKAKDAKACKMDKATGCAQGACGATAGTAAAACPAK